MTIKPTLVILAAGMGSRYGGLKQVDPVGPHGEAILDYSVYDALRVGFDKLVFVIRQDIAEIFHTVVGSKYEDCITVEYAYQELDMLPDGFSLSSERQKPWGTGHAVWITKSLINEPFVVINADDFYGAHSYQVIYDYFVHTSTANYALVGFTLRQTLSDFGAVARGICQSTPDGYLDSVIEVTNIEKDGQQAKYSSNTGQVHTLSGDEIVSLNIWGFQPSIFSELGRLFTQFLQTNQTNPKAEFYIPSAVNALVTTNKAKAKLLTSTSRWFGMTYQEDKPYVKDNIQALINQGVYPEKLVFN